MKDIVGKLSPQYHPQKCSNKKSKGERVWLFQTCNIWLMRIKFLYYLQLLLCMLGLPEKQLISPVRLRVRISTCYQLAMNLSPLPANFSVLQDYTWHMHLASETHLCLTSVKQKYAIILRLLICYTLISQNQETDNSVHQVADTPLSDYSEYLLPDYAGIYANIWRRIWDSM